MCSGLVSGLVIFVPFLLIMWFGVYRLPQHVFCVASRNDYSSCHAVIVEGFMAKAWHVTFARGVHLSLDIYAKGWLLTCGLCCGVPTCAVQGLGRKVQHPMIRKIYW